MAGKIRDIIKEQKNMKKIINEYNEKSNNEEEMINKVYNEREERREILAYINADADTRKKYDYAVDMYPFIIFPFYSMVEYRKDGNVIYKRINRNKIIRKIMIEEMTLEIGLTSIKLWNEGWQKLYSSPPNERTNELLNDPYLIYNLSIIENYMQEFNNEKAKLYPTEFYKKRQLCQNVYNVIKKMNDINSYIKLVYKFSIDINVLGSDRSIANYQKKYLNQITTK